MQISNLQGYGDDFQVGNPQKSTGLLIIVVAAAFSSSAGVYFEMILKDVKVSLWARNFHLAVFSICTALITFCYENDLSDVSKNGFFYGYTLVTWASIIMNAIGGLLVGAVIHYADAVTKDVAIGASITISSAVSVYLFNFEVSLLFILGLLIVILAILIYGEHCKLNIITNCRPIWR